MCSKCVYIPKVALVQASSSGSTLTGIFTCSGQHTVASVGIIPMNL